MLYLRKHLTGEKGFTLVELMITMLILGILVGIVVMTMTISKSRANEATCKANLRTIFEAISRYQVQNEGAYPDQLQDLVDDGFIKDTFSWTCPAGTYDYRDYYDSDTGHTSCPRPSHNP